jgi:hypothetical protein
MPHLMNITDPVYCDECGELARRYYLGNRCPAHAPTERQVIDHAVARAAARERAATHPPRETR